MPQLNTVSHFCVYSDPVDCALTCSLIIPFHPISIWDGGGIEVCSLTVTTACKYLLHMGYTHLGHHFVKLPHCCHIFHAFL